MHTPLDNPTQAFVDHFIMTDLLIYHSSIYTHPKAINTIINSGYHKHIILWVKFLWFDKKDVLHFVGIVFVNLYVWFRALGYAAYLTLYDLNGRATTASVRCEHHVNMSLLK